MKLLLFFLSLLTINLYAQEKKTLEFLNRELRWELKNQFKNSDRIERYDTLKVTEPFAIKNGVLSISVQRKKNEYSENDDRYVETTVVQKQEVPLNKIVKLIKDINVIFITEPNAVKVYENGKEAYADHLFFLQLCCSERYDEVWAEELLDLLKKAGYNIELENWYD
ncbi:hypothetical protein [uncultured Chryseobacterium sp.]|uniref:hypothetical protein n=1 Tax=uncultured Chryseobacterium sp. TaxID=259322 RepID=UPI0026054C63|nr:hypothetical protein [uncultured Chryseobacterium sp.]